jgi:hypothetical protein
MVNASTTTGCRCCRVPHVSTPSSAPQAPNQGTRTAAPLLGAAWRRGRCFLTRSRTMQGRADDQQVLPDGSAFAANLIDDLFHSRIQASGMLQGVKQPPPLSAVPSAASPPAPCTAAMACGLPCR